MLSSLLGKWDLESVSNIYDYCLIMSALLKKTFCIFCKKILNEKELQSDKKNIFNVCRIFKYVIRSIFDEWNLIL